MRNSFRLLRILRTCEKHRIQTEKEKKEKEREERRKRLLEMATWRQEVEKPETKSEDDNDVTPLTVKIVKKVFTSFGGCTALCVFLLMLGCVCGLIHLEKDLLERTCKSLFVIASVLIVLQSFLGIQNNLYREVNLPYYMTMPFTSLELVMAKYLQLITGAYRIMAIILLPLWLGYTLSGGFDGCLTEAVFLGLLIIPQFVMLVEFAGVIAFYSYRRLVVPKNPLISQLIPWLTVVGVTLILVVMELLSHGKVLGTMGKVIWEALVFNCLLGMIIQGMQILPLLLLVMVNVLFWMIFRLEIRLLYRPSILQRWDLADDRKITELDPEKVSTEHGQLMTLFLREIRTIRGLNAYKVSNWLSGILIPVGMMFLYMAMEMVVFRFFKGEKSQAQILSGILVRDILPLSVIPVCMNKAVGTPFSRDAHSLEMLLVMPFDWEPQLHAKVLSSLCIAVKGTGPWVLILVFWLTAKGIIPFWGFLPALFFNLLLVMGVVEGRTLSDIKHPLVKWKKPKEMVRMKNSAFQMLLPLTLLVVSILLGSLLSIADMPVLVCFGWVFFFAVSFHVLIHFQLFIEGLFRLEELGKDREEKVAWTKRLGNTVQDQAKEKNKVFRRFIKEKKVRDFFNFRKK